MAQFRDGNKFSIRNPGGGEQSFEVPQDQLFKLASGDVGVFQGNQLSLFSGKGDFGDLPTIPNERLLEFTKDRFEGGITKVNNPDAAFFKQFQTATDLAPGTFTPFGGFGQPASTLTPEQLAPFEQEAGLKTTLQSRADAAQRFGQPGGQVQAAGGQTTTQQVIDGGLIKIGSPERLQDIAGRLGITPENESQFLERVRNPQTGVDDIFLKQSALTQFVDKGFEPQDDTITGDLLSQEQIDIDGISDDIITSQSPQSTLATVPSSLKSIQDFINAFFKSESDEEIDSLSAEISRLEEETLGQTDLFQQELEKREAEKLEIKLQAVSDEIEVATADLQQTLADIDLTPQTAARAQGAQAAAIRKTQTNIMFLQAQANGYMNKLNLAFNQAQRAVEAKYKPIFDEIKILERQLERAESSATRQEKKDMLAFNFALQERATAAARAQANEQSNHNLMIQLASAGANLTGFDPTADFGSNIAEYGAGLAQKQGMTMEDIFKISASAPDPAKAFDFLVNYSGLGTTSSTGENGFTIPTEQGDITITGYGSFTDDGTPVWEWGLDLVGPSNLEIPFDYEIIEATNNCVVGDKGCNSGFGNQATIKNLQTGEITMISHFQQGSVSGPGSYQAGSSVGTMGNTGTVFSKSGGDGTHYDFTMPKPSGGFFTPQQVATKWGLDGPITNPFTGRDVTAEAQNIATLIDRGQMTVAQIPDDPELEIEVARIRAEQPAPRDPNIDIFQSKITDIDELLSHPGFNESVGPNPFARRHFNFNEFINSNSANFIASVATLIDKETLDTLLALKARGGTLGQVSEKELAILRGAATKLSKFEVKGLLGLSDRIVGFRTTEAEFTKELQKIKDSTQRVLKALQDAQNVGGLTNLTDEELINRQP
ncbi:hypothetical protein CL614_10470 [archaeon]|nr:hypothetical protein [archaeon]